MSQTRVNTTRRNFIKSAAAAAIAAPLIVSAEAHADTSEEYAVALRVVALYAAECDRAETEREGDYSGANYLADQVDAVQEQGSEGLTPNPDSQFFTAIFVAAVREIGRDHKNYVALKDLLAKVDAGADLIELAEADERRREERDEARRKPEPEHARLTREVLAVLADKDDPRRAYVLDPLSDLETELGINMLDPEVTPILVPIYIRTALDITREQVPEDERRAWLDTHSPGTTPWTIQAMLDDIRDALKGDDE